MRRIAIPILIYAASAFSVELSREEILNHAFENSETLSQIDTDREIAESIRREYTGKAFPEINGFVNYEHKLKSYNPMEMGDLPSVSSYLDDTEPGHANDAIIAGAFDKAFSSFDLTPKKNTFAFGVEIAQPIFAQGKVFTGIEIAEVYAETIEQKYQAGQFALAKEITNSYNGALLAQQNIVIQEQAVELAEESHRLTKARLFSGNGNVLDTLNTKFLLQRSEFALRQATKDRRLAVEKMLTEASWEIDPDEVELSGSLELKELNLTQDEAMELVLLQNRNVMQLTLGQEIQALQTKLARSDFLPTVFAGAKLMGVSQYNDLDEMELGGDHKIFAAIQVPIFSGGQRTQRVNQAVFEEDKLQDQFDQVVNQLTLGLTVSFEELEVARVEYIETAEMVALTEKALHISQLAYKVGQITQLDLTNSEQQLSLARLAQNSAVYKVNTAIVSIEELIAKPELIAVAEEIN